MATSRANIDQYQLRMPPGLRDRIKAAAEANNRSMNAEIIDRLEKTFEKKSSTPPTDVTQNLEEIGETMRQQAALIERLTDKLNDVNLAFEIYREYFDGKIVDSKSKHSSDGPKPLSAKSVDE